MSTSLPEAGTFQAPAGASARIKALPFLGRLTCARDRLTAGEWMELELVYEVGGWVSPMGLG